MTSDELQKLPIKELAEYVFEDKQVAADWLDSPNLALYNQSPLDVIKSGGTARVRNLLMRIIYGMLA